MSPTRRMEDLIRSLCRKLIESDENTEEYQIAAAELRSALKKHINEVRKRLHTYPFPEERRSIERSIQ